MTEPLAALDPNGSATVISYDVPEPISYSGRTFLEIPLPPQAFTTVVVGTTPAPAVPGPATPAVRWTRATREVPAAGYLATASLLAPPAVVTGAGEDQASPIMRSPLPLSSRLGALTNADVSAASAAGQQVVLYRDIAGQLDFRVTPAMRMQDDGGGSGPPPEPTIPAVSVFLSSPPNNSTLHGSSAGVAFSVAGTWDAENVNGVQLRLSVDGGAPSPVPVLPDGRWSTDVTLAVAGTHTLSAQIEGTGYSSTQGKQVTVRDQATCTLTVTLDTNDPNPPPVLPTVTITGPQDNMTVVNPGGLATVTVTGKSGCEKGATVVAVHVVDDVTGLSVAAGPVGPDLSEWSIQLLVSGVGRHRLSVVSTDDKGRTSPPQSIKIVVSAAQAFKRLKNRLMIVETMNLSSFLAAFGAGRVVKTFSLLPGEKTTISVKSWTKSAETRKSASSIVDSDASESATDFEDTLSAEQTSREAQSESFNYKIGATVGAAWGWGSASISAEVSGSANSARDEAVKNVSSATRKHSMKASSNRNVTIDTEYTATHEEGTEDSTVREVANINVSRTLNFVFRQMNQEHFTLVHLTNARIAYYTEDLMLDADGNPDYMDDDQGNRVLNIRCQYEEVPLPQLQELLKAAISEPWQPKVLDAVTFALSGIPDYQDELQTVFEWVQPTKDGKQVDGAAYMRFPRNLQTEFEDPASGQKITVPGIVLAYDRIVMRTEGIMVDTVLGQGDGLDEYSHGLQEVAVAERRIAVAERQAELDRLTLARKLVDAKDKQAADIFAVVFPRPTTAIPTVEVIQGGATATNGTRPIAGDVRA
jgi:hypothetical protein